MLHPTIVTSPSHFVHIIIPSIVQTNYIWILPSNSFHCVPRNMNHHWATGIDFRFVLRKRKASTVSGIDFLCIQCSDKITAGFKKELHSIWTILAMDAMRLHKCSSKTLIVTVTIISCLTINVFIIVIPLVCLHVVTGTTAISMLSPVTIVWISVCALAFKPIIIHMPSGCSTVQSFAGSTERGLVPCFAIDNYIRVHTVI